MAADNITTTAGLTGVVQNFLRKAWMDLRMEEFRTPLVNSPLAIQGDIPNNMGQEAEFRKFSHFSPTGTLFGETAEPVAGRKLASFTTKAPIEELVDFISLGHLLRRTDPIDITEKARDLLKTASMRDAHIVITDRFVNQTTISNFGLNRVNTPFNSIFAGGVDSFDDVKPGNVHRMRDWKRAQSMLRNSDIPTAVGNKYVGIIDDAIMNQLLDDDEKFQRAMERSVSMPQRDKVFGDAQLVDFNGITWVLHDDSYRTDLKEEAGALNTRVATGKVHVGHLLGAETFGQISLGNQSLTPIFKVQDITVTGITVTIAYRIPYQGIVLDPEWGLNIVGTTNYSEDVSDAA